MLQNHEALRVSRSTSSRPRWSETFMVQNGDGVAAQPINFSTVMQVSHNRRLVPKT